MKFAIVVCGAIASGKTTTADFLGSHFSLPVVSFGSYVNHMAGQTGLPRHRKSLQDLGDRLYRTLGPAKFLISVLNYFEIKKHQSVVFDGVRHVPILMEIRKCALKTVAVYLDADKEERYRRNKTQLFGGRSPEEFQTIDLHPVELQTQDLKELCDLVLDATQPLPEVRKNLLHRLSIRDRSELHELNPEKPQPKS